MKKDEKLQRTVFITVILVLIKGVLSLISHSVCSFTFHQPSEPDNIEEFLK